MKYLEHVNAVLRSEVASNNHLTVFGQNVAAGSFITGFTKGLEVSGNSQIINSTNTENSLVGFGFGIMLGGGSAAFFMKQLDFLLLGIDQLVNTYNIIRNSKHAKGSFTILPVVVDMGYQGPQSSANNFGDFCSIARIAGYALTNKYDIEKILSAHFSTPGFRIIAVSQRLFKQELIDPGLPVFADSDFKCVQYTDGEYATVVSFNFAFPYAWKLGLDMQAAGLKASVFNVSYMTPIDWQPILDSVKKTGRLVVIDDSKSENLSCFSLLAEARRMGLKKDIFIKRTLGDDWLNPVSDVLTIDNDAIIRDLIA